MAITNLISVEREITGNEVVDAAFVKRYLSISTTTHDTLLGDLIISAREEIEKVACISIVEQTITAEWSQAYGEIKLPNPKILSITSVKDNLDNDLVVNTNYKIIGQSKKTIIGDFPNGLVIEYTAGYGEDTPSDLKLAIAKHVTENFEIRTGISVDNQNINLLPNNWRNTAINYRPTWVF